MGHAALGARDGERLQSIRTTGPSATLTAGTFVFALGPWFPKAFPELMAVAHPDAARPRALFRHAAGRRSLHVSRTSRAGIFLASRAGPRCRQTIADFACGCADRRRRIPTRATARSIAATTRSRAHFSRSAFRSYRTAPLLETRACHYEMSASGNFIIDRFPGFSNVWVAGGGTAEGFKFGPVTGEYIAKRVLGIEDDAELAKAFACQPESDSRLEDSQMSD